MADKQPAKKRLVKNPETFRERALKATEEGEKQDRKSRLKTGGSKVVNPLSQSLSKASGSKSLKPIRKPARLIGKVIFPTYFRESWQELRLVTWPNWQESRRLTFAVLVFAVIFGATIAAVDYGLDKIFRQVLLK